MNSEDKKILEQVKWLNTLGVEYYCSENKLPITMSSNISDQKQTTNLTEKVQELSCDKASPCKEARFLADKAKTLMELKEYLLNFDGCSLKEFATNTVFGDGNPAAKIMLIGEAPGATEDAQGIPFCGESGKLLDNMLASIGITRQQNAYITNTVFWRPPANRAPTDEEIEICRPFVEKHIALLAPKLLILVGSTAATSLLGKHVQITKIRQEYYHYTNQYLAQPIPITAIFHPAYLLRQPMQKKTTWYDLLKVQQFIAETIH